MTHETLDYIAALHAKGYRVTPQRLIVLDAVCELHGHATIAAIQAKVADMDSTIDRSTIYRALAVLLVAGLIVEAEMGAGGKVYSIAGDAGHHHLVCLACGKVLTIDRDELTPLVQHIRETYGFMIQADHQAFHGLCADCSQRRFVTTQGESKHPD